MRARAPPDRPAEEPPRHFARPRASRSRRRPRRDRLARVCLAVPERFGASRAVPSAPVVTRYRCTACGNLTRFDVTTSRRTRAFHHFTVGGELTIEDEEVLAEVRSEEHTSELQSPCNIVCRLVLEKKKIDFFVVFLL